MPGQEDRLLRGAGNDESEPREKEAHRQRPMNEFTPRSTTRKPFAKPIASDNLSVTSNGDQYRPVLVRSASTA